MYSSRTYLSARQLSLQTNKGQFPKGHTYKIHADKGRVLKGLRAKKQPSTRSSLPMRTRILGIQLLLCFVALGIGTRLYFLQNIQAEKWALIASRQHESSIQVQGARGTVTDASGRILAASIRTFSLGAHPAVIKDKAALANALSVITGESSSAILTRLSSQKSFVWLSRGLSEESLEQVKNLPFAGLAPTPEFSRYYPQGDLAGAILGRIDTDGKGLSGIELGFNKVLSAPSMQLAVRRDARGRLLPASVSSTEDEPENFMDSLPALLHISERTPVTNDADDTAVRNEGGSLALSIDSLVQEILEQELEKGHRDAAAKRAYALIMNAETGEILAAAQTPGFNPNQQTKITSELLRNSIIQDSFEPGSTVKPLVAALALDLKPSMMDENIDCENGNYPFGSHVVKDVHPSGVLSFADVLIRSSNIGMAKIGQRLGKRSLYEGLRSLGFGQNGTIELPGESKGILRSVARWADIDVLTHAYGQGVSITPLQLVRAYSALANHGVMVEPTMLKVYDDSKIHRQRVFSDKTADTITDILRGVTEDEHGTGHNAAIPGVSVHGKTGTAQKARVDGRGYDPDAIFASFVGYVDGREIGLQKKLIMFVAIDEPGVKPRWGGVVAAPVFRAAMERVISHLLTKQGGAPLQTASNVNGFAHQS